MKTVLRRFFLSPLQDVMAFLEAHVEIVAQKNVLARTAMLVFAIFATWFIYVPIHELLHVAGCTLWGGEVSRLELSPMYGAWLLKKIFPFVVSGSDYAGQLKGFDTRGNDWIYLSTCFAPFLLTVLFGVAALRVSSKKPKAVLLGIGIVVGLAPFYNMPGDYFEMGSIISTRVLTWLTGRGPEPQYAALRSDDVFKLLGMLISRPAELGLRGTRDMVIASLLVVISGIIDVLLAFLTYSAGRWVSMLVFRSPARTSPTADSVHGP